ncbi:MAG: hypothetical protein QW291_08480 [Thermofilaceae archaeon]
MRLILYKGEVVTPHEYRRLAAALFDCFSIKSMLNIPESIIE